VCSQTPRQYELRKRAERQAETRRRIVEAAVELHTTVGPSRTSIAAIAERAGVQRHTVYAHFPDERSLFTACSTHWAAAHPFPDPAPWTRIAEPDRRLRTALDDVYRWYEQVEPHLQLFARDSTLVPAYGFVTEQRAEELADVADLLTDGLPRRKTVRAAVGHALDFQTWFSLARRQKLTRRQAVDAMVRFVGCV
jgi:AcrR family transcriptional regulator